MNTRAEEELYARLFNEAFAPVIARHGLIVGRPRPLTFILLSPRYRFTINGHFGSQVDAWATIEHRYLLHRLFRGLGPISLSSVAQAAGVALSATDAGDTLAISLATHAHAVDALAPALHDMDTTLVWARARDIITNFRRHA